MPLSFTSFLSSRLCFLFISLFISNYLSASSFKKLTPFILPLLILSSHPQSAVGLDFEERATTMQTLICLPPLAPTAVNTLLGSRGPLGPIVSQFIECGPSSSSSDATATTATPPLPPLKKSTTGTATATTTAENALITSLSRGVATCDQDAFLRRLRMITLCGWSVETLVSGNTSTDAPSSPSPSHSSCSVNPESAMLCCALCGAKGGLWSNFPGCEPQAGAQTASKTAPALPKLQPPPSFQTAGKDMSMSSPNTCGGGGTVLNRNVAINLATTIAGGRMEEGDKNGPFGGGGGTAAAGPFSSSSPAFGLPPPLPRTTNDSNNNTSEVPVFGFDALRAAEQQGASGSLHHRHLSSSSAQAAARHSAAAKRRRDDDTFIQNALGLTPPPLPPPTTTATTVGEKSGIEKRSRTENGAAPSMNKLASVPFSGGGGGASSSATKPTQATLQKYRSMQSTPLDPLLLHRHHCPWVHALSSGSTTTTTTIDDGDNDGCTATGSDSLLPDVMCGWQWCALQLGPGVETIPKSKSGGGGGAAAAGMDDDDYGGDGGTGGAVWDPAAVLRSALAKVEVHPSSKKSVNPKK